MRHLTRIFLKSTILIALTFLAGSCSNDELWDELPRSISTFISRYYPNSDISSYSTDGSSYHVIVKDGPTMVFDQNMSWTSVDGNGLPLPQIFLFDNLPEKLYDYLESGSYLDEVFAVSRTGREYNLKLLQSELHYDIATEVIRAGS